MTTSIISIPYFHIQASERLESKHENYISYISVLYHENVSENIRPMSSPLSWDEVSPELSEFSDCGVVSVKFYLCGLKTGQSSPYQLQIPKPVTEHRNISFTYTALLIRYPHHKTQGRTLCLPVHTEKILGAESTNMQHKQTAQCSSTATNRVQKCRWQQHQKNTALDPQAGVHLGIRTERLLQQQALKP